jgi:hypothetical protein
VSYLCRAEIIIYELAITCPPPSLATTTNISDTTTSSSSSTWVSHLHSCLLSAKASLDNILSFDAEDYQGFSFPMLLHFTHAIHTVYRLSLLDHPSWDLLAVRDTVDCLAYLEAFAANLTQVQQIVKGAFGSSECEGANIEDQAVFAKGADVMRRMAALWRPAVEGALAKSRGAATGLDMGAGGVSDMAENGYNGDGGGDGEFMPMSMDMLDDVIFADFFAHADL